MRRSLYAQAVAAGVAQSVQRAFRRFGEAVRIAPDRRIIALLVISGDFRTLDASADVGLLIRPVAQRPREAFARIGRLPLIGPLLFIDALRRVGFLLLFEPLVELLALIALLVLIRFPRRIGRRPVEVLAL